MKNPVLLARPVFVFTWLSIASVLAADLNRTIEVTTAQNRRIANAVY